MSPQAATLAAGLRVRHGLGQQPISEVHARLAGKSLLMRAQAPMPPTTGSDRAALFLGAGATFDLGMPLASDLTRQVRECFTPAHLRRINDIWRRQGAGYNDRVIDTVVSLLDRDDVEYEHLLEFLRTAASRPQTCARQYSQLYERVAETISGLLANHQHDRLAFIRRGLPPYQGIAGCADDSHPLWVFTTNTDQTIDMIVRNCGLPLRDGFPSTETVRIPTHGDAPVDHLQADTLELTQLQRGRLHYFGEGRRGVNLVRLNGALNVFRSDESGAFHRLRPISPDTEAPVETVRIMNDHVGYWHGSEKLHVLNQVVYAGEDGRPRFLRRTAGDWGRSPEGNDQIDIADIMRQVFAWHLNFVDILHVIGHSFSDSRLNGVFVDWLHASERRRLHIVDPNRTQLPLQLAHLAPQVEIGNATAAEFMAGCRNNPLSELERLEVESRKALRPWFDSRMEVRW